MRVRLALLPPLEERRYLLPVPAGATTVAALKAHVVAALSAVAARAASARQVALEIDGFELLPGSDVGVIQDGDVVCVRLVDDGKSNKRKTAADGVDGKAKKRKTTKLASPAGPAPAPPPPVRRVAAPAHSNQRVGAAGGHASATAPASSRRRGTTASASSSFSSSSSSSSSASSSSSSSSSAASDTSASSSSDSSASSSSASMSSASSSSAPPSPRPIASERPASRPGAPAHDAPPARPSHLAPPSAAHVAPGEGSAATRERNARRRQARRMARRAEQADQAEHAEQAEQPGATSDAVPSSVAEAGAAPRPLSTAAPSVPSVPSVPAEQIVPRNMENRNKKKGFRREMAGLRGVRTTFGDGEELAGVAGAVGAADEAGQAVPLRGAVGAGAGAGASDANGDAGDVAGATAAGLPEPFDRHPEPTTWVPPSSLPVLPPNVFVTSKVYPYEPDRKQRRGRQPVHEERWAGNGGDEDGYDDEEGAVEEAAATNDGAQAGAVNGHWHARHDDPYDGLDDDFESLPLVGNGTPLGPGSLIAYKELALNMATYQPELRVTVARVTGIDGDVLHAERVRRPRAELDDDEAEEEAGAEDEEEGEEAIQLSTAWIVDGQAHRLVR